MEGRNRETVVLPLVSQGGEDGYGKVYIHGTSLFRYQELVETLSERDCDSNGFYLVIVLC